MDNIREEIEKELQLLIKSFKSRNERSEDKETLLKREIEAHEILFDDKRLPLNPLISSNYRPIKNINIYTDGDIVLIREAYSRYIVNGIDIEKSGEYYYVKKDSIQDNDEYYIDSKGRYCKKFLPSEWDIHYFIKAKSRFLYLNWLKDSGSKDEIDNLQDVCKGLNEYEFLKTWFIDNSLCNPNTFIWIDSKKGSLTVLANYLKELYPKGYAKRKLTNNDVLSIAENSFGIKMSLDTVKRAKGNPPSLQLPPYKG